jgi:hypothetical protein
LAIGIYGIFNRVDILDKLSAIMYTETMDIQAIHNEAKTAAVQAENAYLSQHGEPLYCGFAKKLTYYFKVGEERVQS